MSVKPDFAPSRDQTSEPEVRPRLRTRAAVGFAAWSLLLLVGFIVGVARFAVGPYLSREIRGRLRDEVALAALSVDVETVARLVADEPQTGPLYESVVAQLRAARDRITGARFVYIVHQGADGKIYFVADAEESPEEVSLPGSVYDDAGPLLRQVVGSLASPAVEEDFYVDQWGTWLSAYAPLRTADGTLVGILCVDLDADNVRSQESAFLRLGALALLIAAPLAAGGGWLLGRNLTAHLGALVTAVERVAGGDLNFEIPLPPEAEAAQLAAAFNVMTRRLRELVATLEERIAERTADLERQTAYLRATGEVSRVAASLLDLDELLSQVVRLIPERFGFYHAGIFLLDESREWAVLRAASSEGGQRMLARGHRLAVGAQGIVGYVTQTGRPRIALDVGEDMVWFDNPDLPETHSEMALPLIVGGQVIGALDVQSRDVGAFRPEDIRTLAILADQLAVAIANALVFAQRQEAMRELQRTYAQDLHRGWSDFMAQLSLRGYRYTPRTLEALGKGGDGVSAAPLTAPRVLPDNTLLVPVTIAGLELAVLQVRRPPNRPWVDEEISFALRTAQELAQALESARLHQEAQRRASQERLASEIASQLRRSLDVTTVLQTAVAQLGRLPGVAEATVHVTLPDSVAPAAEEVSS